MDKTALFKLSYGLYIVSSHSGNSYSGCVINTMVQVTDDPVQICITINKGNYTTSLIDKSKVFHVTAMLDEVSMDTISRFGFQSGKNVDKYEGITYEVDSFDNRYIKEGMAASFTCVVTKCIDVGSHYMFIADVKEAEVLSDQPVLTYSAYHSKKSSAPVKQEASDKSGYKCDICGYIYEGDTLPEDYICPVCHVDASHFFKV